MKYFAVRAYEIENLEKEVNRRIELGWKVIGGISGHATSNRTMFYQAMIKE